MTANMSPNAPPDPLKLARQMLAADPRYDIDLMQVYAARQQAHPNPFVRFGSKCFSQSDEDGLTLEIIRRIGLKSGTFAEFGVGDGLENNTLILGALGWSGFWVGGGDLAFDPALTPRLHYTKEWITCDNIGGLYRAGLAHCRVGCVDVISLDLDGNDLHLVAELLGLGAAPALFIVEYNAKFPPPVRFSIAYDPQHVWGKDDYYGASLQSFADLFAGHGYRLICCNAATGANAFFVREEHAALFSEVPGDIRDIFVGPHFHLLRKHGHQGSLRTVVQVLGGNG
jgi:hypothetical protein